MATNKKRKKMLKLRNYLYELRRESRQIAQYKKRGWHKEARAVRLRVFLRLLPVLFVLGGVLYLIIKITSWIQAH